MPGFRTTSSPGLTRVTPGPTASMVPAPSAPTTCGSAREIPGIPARTKMSRWLSAAALTRTRTCPGPGTGSGRSPYRIRSRSPCSRKKEAFTGAILLGGGPSRTAPGSLLDLVAAHEFFQRGNVDVQQLGGQLFVPLGERQRLEDHRFLEILERGAGCGFLRGGPGILPPLPSSPSIEDFGGQVRRVHHRTLFLPRGEGLHEGHELPDVPGPGIGGESRDGRRAESPQRFLPLPVFLEKKMVQEEGDILRPLAERRKADRPRGEQVANLLRHLFPVGKRFEIRRRGRAHPEVEFDLLGASDLRDRAVGEKGGDAVQHPLPRLPDSGKEDGPVVRNREVSRPGERGLLVGARRVPEEIPRKHLLVDPRAVHGGEESRGTAAGEMQDPGEEGGAW